MVALDDATRARVEDVLRYVGIGGGAAVLLSGPHRTVAQVGDIETSIAAAERHPAIAADTTIVHIGDSTVITSLGAAYRLVVRVPEGPFHHAFATRVERAATLLRRFVFDVPGKPPPRPPDAAPAEAVVFANVRSRK